MLFHAFLHQHPQHLPDGGWVIIGKLVRDNLVELDMQYQVDAVQRHLLFRSPVQAIPE